MGLLSALLGNAAEADIDDVEQDLEQILTDGEQVERAFKLVRDLLIFTNRRFILVDRQGMTGRRPTTRSRIEASPTSPWRPPDISISSRS
jgi:hypothetical protein